MKMRPPYSYGGQGGASAIRREKSKAKQQSYTSACDFTHLILMSDIMRSEDKNSRAAQMIENAASAVRAANIRAWIAHAASRHRANRPVRRRDTTF
jgi:hypothetical protein